MSFSQRTIDALGHYVYRLVDPRNGTTFYVGKGVGQRVFNHVEELKNTPERASDKLAVLKELASSNLDPEYIIHRHGMDADTAFEVEAALIDCYPNLTNEQGGHHNTGRGAKTIRDIKRLYELPEMPLPSDPVLVINVNHIQNRTDRKAIYSQVKGHWVVSVKNASKMKYVIAAYRGMAIGVFTVDKWYASPDHPRRFCFDGQEAPEDIWALYVGDFGKRIVHEALKNGQNPIKYYRP